METETMEMEATKTEREVQNFKEIDGKLFAVFATREKDSEMWDWTRYEKIFDTFGEFTNYTESFFKLDK